MTKVLVRFALTLVLALVLPAGPSLAQVDFGDDSSRWANDGECDDPRFEGPGMTATPLLEADTLRDATDCREAFEVGRITLREERTPGSGATDDGAGASRTVNFGDDSSRWANDGECDDPRFEGPGMTATELLAEDILTMPPTAGTPMRPAG